MGFNFGTVYVRGRTFGEVHDALVDLMAESERVAVQERGLEPTPDETTSAKIVRSFALLPPEDDWATVVEDGHSTDDGGIAEGLSDLLQTETIHFVYDDDDSYWSYEQYWQGQPLEAGGSEDTDFDVSAIEFVDGRALPHFGVYYEEVAAAAGEGQPALAGALGFVGEIKARVPMGTEIMTFKRVSRRRGPNR
jgi:hypothetical protein